MFTVAAHVAIVEALRATFDGSFPDAPQPRRIDIEYADTPEDWPFVMVQLHVNTITWTGINPDEFYVNEDDPTLWDSYRIGFFDGAVDLTVYATTSEERLRIYDHLVGLFLMGRKRPETAAFYSSLEAQQLIAITVQEGNVLPQGESVSGGTPWNEDLLTFEATLRFELVGQFYADEATGQLLSVTDITTHPYREGTTPFGQGDGNGTWS